MTTPTHEMIEELLGAYALDALDPEERRAVEHHLAECPKCRAEVREHREVASLLAVSGAPAPPGVWDRITAEIEAELPPSLALPPVVPLVAPARANGPRGRARMARGRRVLVGAGAALVAAAAVMIGVLGVKVIDQRDRIADMEQAVVSPSEALARTAEAAMLDSDNRTVELVSTDRSMVARAVVTPDGHGYLMGDEVPRLAEGKTYQLWGVAGDEVISLGVLGQGIDVAAFQAAAGLDALALTEENAPGVPVSSQTPVAVGELV